MYTPFTSRHFTEYTDPVSGVTTAILKTRVAQLMKVIYFTNSGYSSNGRYLWFICADPPGDPYRAVLDFLTDEIYTFPDIIGSGDYVDLDSGELYWAARDGIYKQFPSPDSSPVLVAPVPEYVKENNGKMIICHLTFTQDKKEIAVSYAFADRSYDIGTVNVDSGNFTSWCRTEAGGNYDHEQISPVDKNYIMFAREMWNSKKNCLEPIYIDGVFPRINITDRNGNRRLIPLAGNDGGHEWWSPDGRFIYYVNNDYEKKGYGIVGKTPLDGGEPEIILKATVEGSCNHVWHAFCSQDERLFVFDSSVPSMGLPVWRGCASTVQFFNKDSGRVFRFLTCNPVVEDWTPDNPCGYHIDPHPRFVLNDSLITFTTTVLGYVSVAVTDVEQLVKATART